MSSSRAGQVRWNQSCVAWQMLINRKLQAAELLDCFFAHIILDINLFLSLCTNLVCVSVWIFIHWRFYVLQNALWRQMYDFLVLWCLTENYIANFLTYIATYSSHFHSHGDNLCVCVIVKALKCPGWINLLKILWFIYALRFSQNPV